ncbi:MAG: HAMP domain-containing sensor histidine kinase, partial [Calditrichota bacterium]
RFFLEEIIRRINFPISISSNQNANPTAWKNIGVSPTNVTKQMLRDVTRKMHKMDESHDPIPMQFQELTIGYIHYGDSRIIRELQWLPYIEILVVALFILIAYTGYQTIRRSEQRLIWVGMARETAHQLGTPISSLLGWIELLREQTLPMSAEEIMGHMRRDVRRLEQITSRFSHISSKEVLMETRLVEVIEEVVEYIKKRLPHYNKSVSLKVRGEPDIQLPLNKELMEWALENLIKNGIDAIEGNAGTIEIVASGRDDNTVSIDVIDSGKGIGNHTKRTNIFKPGFSTKKRGWGLGLSLTKRIVEEHHRGKLELISSSRTGTTIRILLFRNKLEGLKDTGE